MKSYHLHFLSFTVVSRARPTLNLPCISPQNSVTCNGEYRRPVIKAQPSFHDVEVDGGYIECLDKWCNLFYAQTFRPTRTHTPFAVRIRLKKMACVMSIIFRNVSFRELKIVKESNDLADLAKVSLESYQKSNEFSVNRKCRQNVATDDRRTFTDKDKVRRIQTLGNDTTKMLCWTAKVASSE